MRLKRSLVVLASALMVTVTIPAFAQTVATEPAASTDNSVDRPIDVDLSGAPLNVRDYVNYLQEATGLNIVLMNDRGVDLTRIEVPPLKLRQMPTSAAIGLLSDLPGANISVERRGTSYIVIARGVIKLSGKDGPVDEFNAPIPHPVTRVFSLERALLGAAGHSDSDNGEVERAKVLAEKTPQALKLIAEALSIDANTAAEQASITIHQATYTLIVRGTPEQLATVEDVLKALAPSAESDADRKLRAELNDLKASARFEVELAKLKVDALQKEIDRLTLANGTLFEKNREYEGRLSGARPAPTTRP